VTAATANFPAVPTPADLNAELTRFTQQLAKEVAGPPIELPSYPVIALRAQRALSDPHASADRIVQIICNEPVLAARMASLANAAAFNHSGKKIADIRTAVTRLGFDALRTAAISFALAQLRNAPAYRSIAEPMNELCEAGVELAALSCVVARATGCATPDSALLAGLVSGVGKLHILTHTDEFALLFADDWMRREMFHHWHAQVTRSVLTNWCLAPEVIDAASEFERAAQDSRSQVRLADVLACSKAIIELHHAPEKLAAHLELSHAARRLALHTERCAALLEESAEERQQLRSALA